MINNYLSSYVATCALKFLSLNIYLKIDALVKVIVVFLEEFVRTIFERVAKHQPMSIPARFGLHWSAGIR